MKKIKWAIWGTGNICTEFAQAIEHTSNGEMCCVLSRNQQSAEEFAKKFSIEKAYSDIEKMLEEGGADAVYIGTPNRAHFDNIMACIAHQKHVLCEKPITINSKEIEQAIQAASAAKVFLMEGMWTLFFPVISKIKQWIENGEIGRVLRVNANFSVNSLPDGWRMGSNQAGGALLDLGIYCLTITDLALGLEPTEIKSMGVIKNGVDIANSVIMKYADDQISAFSCSLDCLSDNKAIIQGDKGYIEIPCKFWAPKMATLYKNEEQVFSFNKAEQFEDKYESTGFQYEAEHVGEMILAGKTESSVVTHEKSCRLTTLMEKMRKDWGIDVN